MSFIDSTSYRDLIDTIGDIKEFDIQREILLYKQFSHKQKNKTKITYISFLSFPLYS